MNIEDFRKYCLSLGDDVTEATPFGKFAKRYLTTLVFYVGGHMFCLTDIDNFTFVELRTTPEEGVELEERHLAVAKTINPILKNWVHIELGKDISDSRVRELVAEAYDIVSLHYAKKS